MLAFFQSISWPQLNGCSASAEAFSITIKDCSCIVSIDVAVSDHFVLYKIDDSLFCTLYPSCGHVRQDLSVLLTSVEEWSRGAMKL